MKKDEFIKLGLTEEQAAACEKASLEELKTYIPKTRFDEVNEAKKAAESQVTERDRQLEALKKAAAGSEELQKQIEQLQADNRNIRVDAAIEKALTAAKAKNTTAVKALLKDLDKAELTDDGNIKGLDEQIKALVKSDAYLFESEPEPEPASTPSGVKPGESKPKGDNVITKAQFNKMSYREKVNLFNTDKETYDALAGTSE